MNCKLFERRTDVRYATPNGDGKTRVDLFTVLDDGEAIFFPTCTVYKQSEQIAMVHALCDHLQSTGVHIDVI